MYKAKTKFLILFLITCLLLIGGLMLTHKTARAEPIDELNVKLIIDGVTYRYAYPDITYKSGFEKILIKQGVYDSRGRLKSIKGELNAEYEFKNLRSYLENIALTTDITPIPAEVEFEPQNIKFKVKRDIKGRKLNVDKIVKDVEKSLKKGKSYSAAISSDITDASVTEKSLKRTFFLRSTFSTDISNSTAERKNNIKLSLKQFNGLVVKPDEIVSFNQTVGPRTAERGYLPGKIIVNGEFIEGVGGGVCQTSTTLYNALLLSDIEITSYRNHTLNVSYVPASFDAMVSSAVDLKFKNNSKNYVYIRTVCTDKTATVEIYGEKLDYKIERKSEIVFTGKVTPEKKVIDEKGEYLDKVKYKDEFFVKQISKPEIKSVGYLEYIKDGKVIKRKKIRNDTYKALTGEIIYGNLDRPKPLIRIPEPAESPFKDYLF